MRVNIGVVVGLQGLLPLCARLIEKFHFGGGAADALFQKKRQRREQLEMGFRPSGTTRLVESFQFE